MKGGGGWKWIPRGGDKTRIYVISRIRRGSVTTAGVCKQSFEHLHIFFWLDQNETSLKTAPSPTVISARALEAPSSHARLDVTGFEVCICRVPLRTAAQENLGRGRNFERIHLPIWLLSLTTKASSRHEMQPLLNEPANRFRWGGLPFSHLGVTSSCDIMAGTQTDPGPWASARGPRLCSWARQLQIPAQSFTTHVTLPNSRHCPVPRCPHL